MPENNLMNLMSQAEALQLIPIEGSYEWFDDMIPKAQKLLQQIQREQTACSNDITSQMFNKIRDCSDSLERWIQYLGKRRADLDGQKSNVIKCQMNKMSIHNGAYSSFRGFFGK